MTNRLVYRIHGFSRSFCDHLKNQAFLDCLLSRRVPLFKKFQAPNLRSFKSPAADHVFLPYLFFTKLAALSWIKLWCVESSQRHCTNSEMLPDLEIHAICFFGFKKVGRDFSIIFDTLSIRASMRMDIFVFHSLFLQRMCRILAWHAYGSVRELAAAQHDRCIEVPSRNTWHMYGSARERAAA